MKKILFLSIILFVVLSSCNDNKNQKQTPAEIIMEMSTPVELRNVVCSVCRGTGKNKCKKCNASGIIEDKRVLVNGEFNSNLNGTMDCDDCDGYGFFVCSECGGTGVVKAIVPK